MVKTVWKKLDGKDLILGRMCTQIAKKVLLGEHIVVINAKDIVISGIRSSILERYVKLNEVRTRSNPTHGPFHNKRPDTFVRQKVRQMLPNNVRGEKALKNVHVYIHKIPKMNMKKYSSIEDMEVQKASKDRLSRKYITVSDLCSNIGWKDKSMDNIKV